MGRARALFGALIVGAGSVVAHTPAARAEDASVPLISREVLFGNPDRTGVQISPDGKHLSWLAPHGGVLNVWVAPIGDLASARPITNDRTRGIRVYFWAFTNDSIIYLQDQGGDENFQVHITDINSAETRNLTAIEHVIDPATGKPIIDPSSGKVFRPRATITGVSHLHPDEILIGINDRNPAYFDQYRLNLRTGERSLIEANDQFGGFVADEHYTLRLATRPTPDGGAEYLRRAAGNAWEPFQTIGPDDSLTTSALGLSKNGESVYMLDSRGRNTAALATIGIDSGAPSVIAADDRADISEAMIHPTEQTVQAVASTFDRQRWQILDPSIKDDFQALEHVADGEFAITARTLDDKTWVVAYILDNGPVGYYLYDRASRKATYLFSNRADLESVRLAKMHPVVIRSRDGLDLVSYFTLPVWSDSDGDARPSKPMPMVLLVHGGPWARDEWGYNSMHQWLANRGYAVLSVNYRGSTGFGKNFINAGNQAWATTMHDDLIDAVDWAIAEGIADPAKVAIMGGSYGGYATLVGLTFTPDKFAAGVDIVGPSNLITLLNSIPPYWKTFRDQFRLRVGDIDTPEGRRLLRDRSPLTHVDEIRRPLLIGQGANDPRVKQPEADQIVDAMTKRQIPVTYVLYPDEGHGFVRPENRLSFFAVTEAFLSQHLGGVYEEIGDDFKNSSIQVPTGAEHVPGVGDALQSTR